jgi:hypoxanthine-guanine phosphoribosyltransferase
VLVLDDVFTEGGTMQQVAEVLRRMGASDVAGLVLARPVWQPAPPGGDAGRGSTVQA